MRYEERPRPPIGIGALRRIIRESITSKLPPADFDPLTAPQEALAEFGFPSRPDQAFRPAEYAFWREMFAPKPTFQAFDFDIVSFAVTERRGFIAQLPRRQTSFNWSGAYIMPRDGTVFWSMWSQWRVPTPNVPPGGAAAAKYRSSTWIGFDGQRRYHESSLPQIGTSQNIDLVMGVPTPSYFAWWEWWVRGIANTFTRLLQPTIHAGDLIRCFMQVANTRSDVSFVITNLTTNVSVQFTQTGPPDDLHVPFKVSGATAEWVMERSSDPPDPTPLELPDYGTVDFTDCGATAINMDTGAKVARSLSAAQLIDMYVVRQHPERTVKISIATPIDDTEFSTHFQFP
jgi:Peptidase A4 family